MTTRAPLKPMTPGQRVATIRAAASVLMPYFRSGILTLIPREVPGLGTMGVTADNQWLIDQKALETLNAAQGATVTLHEYLHRFLQHAERALKLQKAGVLRPELLEEWGNACEAEVNHILTEARCEFPTDADAFGAPVTAQTLGLEPGQTAEQYFHQLLRKREEKQQKGQPQSGSGASSEAESEAGADGEGGEQQKGASWGREGSGMGVPLPCEPEPSPDAPSPAAQAAQRRRDAEALAEAQRGRKAGSIPAGLARFAEALLEPPKVPWQQKLTRSVQRAVAFRQGCVDYTWTERSRAQASLEMFFDPAPVLPGMHAPICEVAFALDTSASMQGPDLQEALREAGGVLAALGGAQVTFQACDAAVHSQARVRSLRELLPLVKGGGGTDFRPIFAALDKAKPRPHLVIVATDGYGCAPSEAPRGMDVIFLLVGSQTCVPYDSGGNSVEWAEVIEA